MTQAFGVWWFYAALGARPDLGGVAADRHPGRRRARRRRTALGERPGAIATVGIVLALIAVVLVSREATDKDITPHRFTDQGRLADGGLGLAFGLNFVLIAQAPEEAGLWPLVFARVSASVLVLVIAALTANLRLPSGAPLKLALLAAVLDTVANVAMLLALQASLLSLAGVLISLYPAATVVLAIVVLRERVTRWQAVGMVLALAAVAMIAAG